MINSTGEFAQAIYEGNRNYKCKCNCILANNKSLTFNNSNLMHFEITDATASDGFEIGAAIAKTMKIKLQNYDDDFSDYDFYKAELNAYVGLEIDGKIQYLNKGHFTVDDPAAYGSIITLSLIDDMYKFSKNWDTSISFPTTVFYIVSECCSLCNVQLAGHFDNDDIVVNKPEDISGLTCRDVISYCAQISGNNARMNVNNLLELKWYKDFEEDYDGGTFSTNTTPYSDGDSLDGGDFKDYSSGDTADGGSFVWNYTQLYSNSKNEIGTDDIIVTGIAVTVDEETYATGDEGYILQISDNPFINQDNAQTICTMLYQRIGGMKFRKFSVDTPSDPRREAGDLCIIYDRKKNEYHSIITSITFTFGTNDKVSNNAEDVIEKNTNRYSATTKALIAARKYTNKRLSSYDVAVKNMNALALNSMGYHETFVDDPETGTRISYMHDQPTLEGSTKVWMNSENGHFWTDDYKGAETKWKYGDDVNGNAIRNILSVVGINFDWAHGGTLVLGGSENGNGTALVKDVSGNIISKLDNNGVNVYKGLIQGTTISLGSNFYASDEGTLIAKSGKIGPWNFSNESFLTDDYNMQIYKQSDGSWFLTVGDGSMWCDHLVTTGLGSFDEVQVVTSLKVSGTKSRLAKTENYNARLLYCYEMPTPMFGDLGEGETDDTGICIIYLDDIFAETIDAECLYQIFLQPYAEGSLYVYERNPSYFIVKGTPGMKFGWEIKAVQKGFDTLRLETNEREETIESPLNETSSYLQSLLFDLESEEME